MPAAVYPFYQVDVFTNEGYYGNPLAVVLVLDPSLPVPTTEQMKRLATWTNLSETTFLLPPSDPSKANYKVRIFTPKGELPFAGHPTLGTCSVFLQYAQQQQQRQQEEWPRKVVQECGIGLVELRATSLTRISFVAPPLIKMGPVAEETVHVVCRAMGIDRERDVVDTQWIANGPPWFALFLKDVDTVLRARSTTTEESKSYDWGIVAQYPSETLQQNCEDPLFVVRVFPHNDCIQEDPVCGSFNAGLAKWLMGIGKAPPRYVVSQGTVLGRRGRIHVQRDDSDPSVAENQRKIWVGGEVTLCIQGSVSI